MDGNVHNGPEDRKDGEELTETPLHGRDIDPGTGKNVESSRQTHDNTVPEGVSRRDASFKDSNRPKARKEEPEEEEITELCKDRDREVSAKKLKEERPECSEHDAKERNEPGAATGRFPNFEEKERKECKEKSGIQLHGMNGYGVTHGHRIHLDSPQHIGGLPVRKISEETPQPVECVPEHRGRNQRIQPLQKRRAIMDRRNKKDDCDTNATTKKTERSIPKDKVASRILEIDAVQHEDGEQASAEEKSCEVCGAQAPEVRHLQSLTQRKSEKEFRRQPDSQCENEEMAAEEERTDLVGLEHADNVAKKRVRRNRRVRILGLLGFLPSALRIFPPLINTRKHHDHLRAIEESGGSDGTRVIVPAQNTVIGGRLNRIGKP